MSAPNLFTADDLVEARDLIDAAATLLEARGDAMLITARRHLSAARSSLDYATSLQAPWGYGFERSGPCSPSVVDAVVSGGVL